MYEKTIEYPTPPTRVKGWPVQIFKITINYDRDYAIFGPVRSNILDLSVYDREAGSSLIVYTKLEGEGG